MARLVGPDEGSRLAYVIRADGSMAIASGLPAVICADQALTQPADILTVGGQPIDADAVEIGADSLYPLFQFPDNVEVLYSSVNGGPVVAIYARATDQVSAHAALTAGVHGIADTSALETTSGAQAKATAAQNAAIAASLLRAANLSDLANAATARTNLGLGGAAVLPVGTMPGTVAAGDDSRIVGARGSFGYPATLDPITVRGTDSATLGAGECWYLRVSDGGVISKIGLEIVTSSGNISVAAYRNGGTGLAAVPATRLATSGAVACPTAGYAEISLGATITVNPGDWLSLSSDNGTAAFRCMLGGVLTSQLAAGRIYMQTSAHPAPSPPGALAARLGRNILLIGVA